MIKYIKFGSILGVHGLKGEVLIECLFENFKHFVSQGVFIDNVNGIEPIKIQQTGIKKGGIIVSIENCVNKEDATKLLNKNLFIDRKSLDDLDDSDQSTHFVADLLDLNVFIDGYNDIFGTVIDVVNFGNGPLLEIKLNKNHKKNLNKKEKLEYYEKNTTTIKEVNLKAKLILLNNNI